MKPRFLLLVLLASTLPGCFDDTADEATVHNLSLEEVEVRITYTGPDGAVLRDENVTLAVDERHRVPLDHPRDGTYILRVEAEDGRAAQMSLSWQGSTGPRSARFEVHEDRIEELQVVT